MDIDFLIGTSRTVNESTAITNCIRIYKVTCWFHNTVAAKLHIGSKKIQKAVRSIAILLTERKMDSLYGINVKNKFDLFYDEDVDPLEILAQQENAKKTEQDKKKKEDKGKKNKNAKKQVLKTENKNKPAEEIKPEKEGKVLIHYY